MDAERFDEVVRRVADPSRRTVFGAALAALAALLAPPAEAERRKGKKRGRKKSPQKKESKRKDHKPGHPKKRSKRDHKKGVNHESQRRSGPPPGAPVPPPSQCEHGRPCAAGSCCPGEQCREGLCVLNQNASCVAVGCPESTGNPCTHYVCNRVGGVCEIQPLDNGTPCEDGNPCTENDTCLSGVCTPGRLKECSPSTDPCKVNVCNPATGACEPRSLPDIVTLCNDNNACTREDVCIGGECVGRTPVVCQPGTNPCQNSVCNPQSGACEPQNLPDERPCDDNNACTMNNRCVAGRCVGDAVSCPDDANNPCTAPTCDPATGCGMISLPNGTPCGTGGGCGQATCQNGTCQGGGICPVCERCGPNAGVNTCIPNTGSPDLRCPDPVAIRPGVPNDRLGGQFCCGRTCCRIRDSARTGQPATEICCAPESNRFDTNQHQCRPLTEGCPPGFIRAFF